MKRKTEKYLLIVMLIVSFFGCAEKKEEIIPEVQEEMVEEMVKEIKLEEVNQLPEGDWQVSASFPDRLGRVDDTLAMNSIVSFDGFTKQGEVYVVTANEVESFDLYINSYKAPAMEGGKIYKLDHRDVSLNGRNSIQVSGLKPDKPGMVSVYVPYPEVISGDLVEEGFNPEAFELISDLIASDIEYGFPSAQLAVIRNDKLVYENTWGYLNRYEQDGTLISDPVEADNDTLYDLASVTKMFGANYALQKLVDEGKVSLDDKVSDYLGERFYEDTLDFTYTFGDYIDPETMRQYKAGITIRNLVRHEAGFVPAPRYFNPYIEAESQEYIEGVSGLLFAGTEHSQEAREATLEAICKTPLLYRPGSRSLYSDVDYMILAYIIEMVSSLDLDTYMKQNFFEPMGLERITFVPLEKGFDKNDCAATELNGNTRDGAITFPGIREYTLQGEVHDEMSWYSMNGISGHAGLFADAEDLATLASVMFTGGYGNHRFFSRNVMDVFMAPNSINEANSGLGWARQGDDQRSWYFGSQSSSATIGHQGWTGTLVMIDPVRKIVMAYLTNERNTALPDNETNANDFNGLYYTASTLGFVPQIMSIGLDEDTDIHEQLLSLLESMVEDARRLIPEGTGQDHAAYLNYLSKQAVYEKWKNS